MIRRIVHFIWHEILDILSHLRVLTYLGIISLVISFTPEDLVKLLVEWLPERARSLWPSLIDFRIAMVIVGVAIIVGDIVWQKIKKAYTPVPQISAILSVDQREDIQIALVRIVAHNTGKIAERITRIDFVTKGHWDILDRTVMANPTPVIPRLGRGHPPFIKISPEIGARAARAARAVGETLQPGMTLPIEFLLTTDHSPNPAMGIFPFHLGVELVHGDRDERLPLPDLLVSLHGQEVLSFTRVSGALPYAGEPGDDENFANAALSRVNQNVICSPALVAALKSAAR